MKRSWTWRDVLPPGAALTVGSVVTTEAGVLVKADGRSADARRAQSGTLRDQPYMSAVTDGRKMVRESLEWLLAKDNLDAFRETEG